MYPYREGTLLSGEEALTLSFPEEQTYAEKSFGPGANPMVSISSDNDLQFKNVGGYLVLNLYGAGVSVSSVELQETTANNWPARARSIFSMAFQTSR